MPKSFVFCSAGFKFQEVSPSTQCFELTSPGSMDSSHTPLPAHAFFDDSQDDPMDLDRDDGQVDPSPTLSREHRRTDSSEFPPLIYGPLIEEDQAKADRLASRNWKDKSNRNISKVEMRTIMEAGMMEATDSTEPGSERRERADKRPLPTGPTDKEHNDGEGGKRASLHDVFVKEFMGRT